MAIRPDRPNPNKGWLKEYNEHQEYGDVYVVKKIASPCRSCETFLTDESGCILTPAYRDIGDFVEGLAEFVPMKRSQQKHGLHVFIDKRGKVVIDPKYISTDQFHKGRNWVIYPVGTQYGLSYIDRTEKEIYKIPIHHYSRDYLIYDSTIDFLCNHDIKENVLWWRNGKFFILNFNFTPFVEQQLQQSKSISSFKYQRKFGIIDTCVRR